MSGDNITNEEEERQHLISHMICPECMGDLSWETWVTIEEENPKETKELQCLTCWWAESDEEEYKKEEDFL